MDKEKIMMCLDFAEGKKGKFTILMTKKPNFPDSLIEGTEKQQEILEYVKIGKPTRKIADILGCSQPTVVEHMRNYKRGVEFHACWCEFWEYIAPVRSLSITEAFDGIVSESFDSALRMSGIETVGDFLLLVARTPKKPLYSKYMDGYNATVNEKMFDRLRELCLSL